MLRQRVRYWSCSRFADWVRGEKKPSSLPLGEWGKWREDLAKRKPVRCFLAEKGLNGLQNFLMFPFDLWRTVRRRFILRFVERPYCLDTGLSKWDWHEFDERIIHGLFNELKNFVEVELAHAHNWGENRKKYRFRGGRCPEAGVDHLLWASSLRFGDEEGFKKGDPERGKPTPQAVSAKKILELYRWWLARPSRPDPMEASGWSEVWDSEDRRKRDKASKRLREIEEEYDSEDEKMLVRLIKLRKHLWT